MLDIFADKTKIPLPVETPETAHFWAGTKAGQLCLQRCDDCQQVYFPPRPFCPACACRSVSVFVASGRATLYSYVINHRPHPAFNGPYAIAVVTLEEGPRMMANIVHTPQTPAALQLDMALQVVFEAVSDDVTLAYFQPREGQ
ncbi:MAG: OB-fold domain-containing protein [Pseudomonadales bacterium]|jgi:uncharacterized protein|nr:OB-fold domain-containing protein [Pseudomonadales bacterium]MDP4639292.1 OB-fold domain-containing protein [Pseudomonadales bacterium]MDP4766674.1 OB-fold domain-containing protein [Pseudomonadales bacterium]MDP4874494.1 OB-fold domain-containing protein [Pseudomonadales bacterium]MDP4910463.1 OB-fold domain-containing protein [Pseudomonadales bacterium]